MITLPFPKEGEYPPYFGEYYKRMEGVNPSELLAPRLDSVTSFWRSIPEEKGNYAYAEGKWTIKQVIGHITDTERIMSYRTMCIVRGEKQSLPGFEENDYAANGRHNDRTLASIINEWEAIRKSNIILFSTFNMSDVEAIGMANNYKISVTAIIHAIVAHEMHHTMVLTERYGI
ncbi:MAG: DinB family protein [Sphingobacteriales bacterium JAD_PAG50586_3]|nr:MAG: DinB family protein [Sphingobacteriales bacterium JAD_PAG50586_3]